MIAQFSGSPKLQDILKIIEIEPENYSDIEIVQCVTKFLPSYNGEGAAKGYFSIISHLCYYRPDLEFPLMKVALRPLYYLGMEDPDSVIEWVQFYVSDINTNYYYTSKQGNAWIKESLKSKRDIIAAIFKEIDFEDNTEWDR
ncbi:hypothetical protein ACWIE6_03485 [Paenibacillus taichungensis]